MTDAAAGEGRVLTDLMSVNDGLDHVAWHRSRQKRNIVSNGDNAGRAASGGGERGQQAWEETQERSSGERWRLALETMSCGHGSEQPLDKARPVMEGGTRLLEALTVVRSARRGRAGGTGGARRNCAARATERRGSAQRDWAILTFAERGLNPV
jgi:hypothetical protein